MTPRVEFLSLGGINSDLRIDVIMILAVSILPLLKPLQKKHFAFITAIASLCVFHLILFDAEFVRICVGMIFYISFVSFSLYKRFLTIDDIIFIAKWFLVINSVLHILDLGISVSSNHNFSFRYGVFNQHFAYATALIICFYFLKLNNRGTFILSLLFWSGFLLSGSRGIILAFLLVTLFETLNFKRWSQKHILAIIIVPLVAYVLISTTLQNVHFDRIIKVFEILISASGDLWALLEDPALNVRLRNFYNYLDHISVIHFGWLYVLIGGGPFNFLDYSVQYGKPGHFDNTYLRLISEFGLIAIIALFSLILALVFKNPKTMPYVLVLLIGGLVSEAIFSLKVGHLFFLTYMFLVRKK